MANKMLIDATHPEETRVVVLRGNRVEEFDFESAQRKQLRGNIYLAKVTRVEPSLQAAFIDYGGNRHGFLAFSEIHPDYYQIPVADRQALIEEEERAQRAAEDEVDRRSRRHRRHGRSSARRDDDVMRSDLAVPAGDAAAVEQAVSGQPGGEAFAGGTDTAAAPGSESAGGPDDHADAAGGVDAQSAAQPEPPDEAGAEDGEGRPRGPHGSDPDTPPAAVSTAEQSQAADRSDSTDVLGPAHDHADDEGHDHPHHHADDENHDHLHHHADDENHDHLHHHADDENHEHPHDDHADDHFHDHGTQGGEAGNGRRGRHGDEDEAAEEVIESVGGADALEEVPDRAPRYRRQYKIQEVIKRRQVMLVQVVKEERGTKGAALTTYLSLAGRYSVLMPNTARGGGISRKITSAEDRSRLKEIAQELEVPEGMGVILRTAGASRTKTEIKRDFEYLLRMWERVRDLTLRSTAAKLVYEEGSLVKRSIRDLYSKEIDEVVVAGSEAYEEARDFMGMLMPSHARNVKPYAETQPLLSRFGVESQLDAMFSPVVQLRSGGYIVLNQTEALVAIDVNSGRATREHHIEDTALKTNLEAADEIARQLRLRDLAGLIVIDFIDMEEKRNNRAVERRLKECLKLDRARIQVGRISHFGLLEMSRQRIRTSVLESSTEKCSYCGGTGHVRSVSSLALQVLRALEEQLMKAATHNLIARTRPDVALYVLNQKRAHLRSLEERFAITITVAADESVTAPQAFLVERGEQVHTAEAARARAEQSEASTIALAAPATPDHEEEFEEVESEHDELAEAAERADAAAEPGETGEAGEAGEAGSRRRRRRRRRGRDGQPSVRDQQQPHHNAIGGENEPAAEGDAEIAAAGSAEDTNGHESAVSERGEPRDGERRRRRRGRRGGRRNRPEREGDTAAAGEQHPQLPAYAAATDEPASEEPTSYDPTAYVPTSPEDFGTPPVAEPALKEAVADLDAAPAPADASAEHATATDTTASRRRSTVREPAPGGGHASHEDIAGSATPPTPVPPPIPEPQPAITEAGAADDTDRPRRKGWWSRRAAGG